MHELEQTTTDAAETKINSKHSKLRAASAVAATALSFLAPGEIAEAAPQEHSVMLAPVALTSTELKAKKIEHGFKLKNIEELPGYGLKPNAEARKELVASTIKIVKRDRYGESSWQEHCTGMKVSIGGESFITSAKHCFDDLGWRTLSEEARKKVQSGESPVINLGPNAPYQYAIIDPGPKKRGWPTELPSVIADITDILVDPSNPNDWALLKPDISKINKGPSVFEDIPALDIMKMNQAPIVGQEVALYGLPQVTNHKPVAGKGIYIGETINTGREGRVAWIAMRAKDQVHDSYLFGASGSSASTGGAVFSSLAWRSNFGYPGNKPRHWYDAPLKNALVFRSELEMSTGVNLKGISTVGGFTVDYPKHWLELKQGRNTIASPMDKGGEIDYPEKVKAFPKNLPEEDIPQMGGYDPEAGNK